MNEYLTILLAVLLVVVWVKPLAGYMTAVYLGLPHPLQRGFGGVEQLAYRLAGIRPEASMSWRCYAGCILVFGVLGVLLLFLLLLSQGFAAHAAFNAAVSFVTNTNWQSYGGERLSLWAQMAGLGVQMFLSSATGLAVGAAFCRSIAAKQADGIGNFWVDLSRSVLYVLLPLSCVFAVMLASQGVIQNLTPSVAYVSLEGTQGQIPGGPVAWQTAIKMLGGNGGGFFNANAAHPFENPNAITHMLQIAAIFLLPVAFTYSAGMLMRDRRQGIMLLVAMTLLFIPLCALVMQQEMRVSPKFDGQVIDIAAGNLEGKETRLGVVSSAFWAAAATATANGSAPASYDTFAPLSGFAQLLLMQLGEVVFGSVGVGVVSMLLYVFMTVFIAGLMVGRTPEFMGKKLCPFDMQMTALALLIPACLTLMGTAVAVSTEAGRLAVTNPGPHGFTQVLYAFSSASNNNGSAFAGLQSDSAFYNLALGACMFIGRYGVLLCMLSLAGSFAAKNITPSNAGTLPTHTPLFTMMLIMMVLLLGLLTYIPALALGPVAEHLLLAQGAI